MTCPVCGYETDSEDVACLTCGSDMAVAVAPIALEKRRSQEVMDRYHDQQMALRRELGIDDPQDEPMRAEEGGDETSPEGQVGPREGSLEWEGLPSDVYSEDILCPYCGFKNGDGTKGVPLIPRLW